MSAFKDTKNQRDIFFSRPVNTAGFTLIEMSILVVIVGIFLSIMATVLPSMIQFQKTKDARENLEMYQASIRGYAASQKRFPCPDTDSDGLENRNDSGTPGDPGDDTCAAYTGTLAFANLGLPSGNDMWNNKLRYGVHEDLIKTTGRQSLCITLKALRVAPFDSAKLYTSDATGSFVNQAYVMVSSGPNTAFNGENSNADVRFESPDKITDANYDDLVRAGSVAFFWDKLCAGGNGTGENNHANNCDNGIDDDNNSSIDCADPACAAVGICP